MKRTKLSVCIKKKRYSSYEDAIMAIQKMDIILRPYKCNRCFQFHLTSRTKGKWIPRLKICNS